LCLTGIRVGALTSLRIKHIDLVEKSVFQDPREVATKFGKQIDTFFAKGFPDAEKTLAEWIKYQDEVIFFGPDDPLFPATAFRASASSGFQAEGFKRQPWKSTEPVRKIVNNAFACADLPAYGPHAFRHMLARHATQNSKSVAELIAVSQNLGHSELKTTLNSYGQISGERQRSLITGTPLPDKLIDE
jgi:integrase